MKRRVAIVGGGFGGLAVAQKLAERVDEKQTEIVLIDRSRFHTLKPKLPQAVGGRIPCAVHVPFSHVLKGRHVQFLQKEVTAIRADRGEIHFDEGAFDADYIVIAAGCRAHIPEGFQHENALFPVWNFEQACQIRRRIGFLGQAAAAGKDVDANVVVIGGGFVGVEMAAELQQRFNRLGMRHKGTHVTLIEASGRLLPRLEEGAGARALRHLNTLGVDIRLQSTATQSDGKSVTLDDGDTIACGTAIGACGVESLPFLKQAGRLTDASGRIPVTSTLQSLEHENVYALGDCAYLPEVERRPEPSAHRAAQQAAILAKNLAASLTQRQMRPYRDRRNKYLIGLGPEFAIANVPPLPLASGRAPALVKEGAILRHLAGIGGMRLAKDAASHVTLSALKSRCWDGAPLDEGCILD